MSGVASVAIFIWLLRPLLAFHRTSNPDSTSYFRHRITKSLNKFRAYIPFRLPQSDGPYLQAVNQTLVRAVEWLVWKTLIGTVLIVIPTIANLALMASVGGREQAWLCFTICTVDGKLLLLFLLLSYSLYLSGSMLILRAVTWAVCVIHWLTVDPLEVDSRPTTRAAFPLATTERPETQMSEGSIPMQQPRK